MEPGKLHAKLQVIMTTTSVVSRTLMCLLHMTHGPAVNKVLESHRRCSIKKESPTQGFFCQFWEISKKIFFYRAPPDDGFCWLKYFCLKYY